MLIAARSTSLLLLFVVINNCAPQSHCFAIEKTVKRHNIHTLCRDAYTHTRS